MTKTRIDEIIELERNINYISKKLEDYRLQLGDQKERLKRLKNE